MGVEGEFVASGFGVGCAEEEEVAVGLAFEEVVDSGGELLDVGFDHVEEVFTFGFDVFFGAWEEEPGFALDQVAESGEGDGGRLEVVLAVGEEVAEIGFADGRKGDVEEVDFAFADAGEEESERAGEGRGLDMDFGRIKDAEWSGGVEMFGNGSHRWS